MKYASGEDVNLGDKVKLGQDADGVVVCSIDTGEYTDQYPREKWEYLKAGVLINFPQHGLIHYEKPEPDLQLIARASAP